MGNIIEPLLSDILEFCTWLVVEVDRRPCVAGRDEGVYEWVAANYAHGMLQNDPSDTIGVLTLGDQSAQVFHYAHLPSTLS